MRGVFNAPPPNQWRPKLTIMLAATCPPHIIYTLLLPSTPHTDTEFITRQLLLKHRAPPPPSPNPLSQLLPRKAERYAAFFARAKRTTGHGEGDRSRQRCRARGRRSKSKRARLSMLVTQCGRCTVNGGGGASRVPQTRLEQLEAVVCIVWGGDSRGHTSTF